MKKAKYVWLTDQTEVRQSRKSGTWSIIDAVQDWNVSKQSCRRGNGKTCWRKCISDSKW
jgi:hypothetical protein